MSSILEQQLLPVYLVEDIKNIIFSYLTFQDLKISNLLNYIPDNRWKERVIFQFGDIILDKNSNPNFNTWFNFYCYLDYMTYGRAKIVRIPPEIAKPLTNLDRETLTRDYGVIYDCNWGTYFIPEFYELIKDLKEGDVVIIDEHTYFLISTKIKKGKERRQCDLYLSLNRDYVHSWHIITKYPIAYWSDSEVPQLNVACIQINKNSIEEIHIIKDDETKVESFLVLVEKNIAYALFDNRKGCFSINFQTRRVVSLSEYPQYIPLLSAAKLCTNKTIDSIKEKYNLSWDRVFLSYSLLASLE